MAGIVSYGSYVPYWRLDRKAISATLGTGGGKGSRAVASFDEDTTTMGVEAARNALGARAGIRPERLLFATSDPAYLDKTNATAVHAALGLAQDALAVDIGGAPRSTTAGLLMAAESLATTVLVTSDTRTGLPGSTDENIGGDAAAALVFGNGAVVCELVAHAHSSAEFLDRWRTPGAKSSGQWEERFGEGEYVPLARNAIADAFKAAELSSDAIHHVIVTGVHARAVGVVRVGLDVHPGVVADDLTSAIGNAGAAAGAIVLCDVLDRAGTDETIVQINLADGVDVFVWKTTSNLAAFRASRTTPTVRAQIDGGAPTLPYAQFLTWKGHLVREPPRRPDPDRISAPAAGRGSAWKFGFAASRCLHCGTRHLPPMRVCMHCHAVDEMTPERLAGIEATVATFTIDRLAFSMSPPVVAVVIDFDGGGRFMCELTDCTPTEAKIGLKVEMTFRKMNTAQSIHNYFWKAKPVRG
jgi:hydroxymethylglutaryl-CoA synthase